MFHSSWVVVMMMVITIMMMRNGWTSVSDQGLSWRVMTHRLTHSLGLPQLYPTPLSLQLIINVPPKTDHQLTIILRAFITPTLIEGMTNMVSTMFAMIFIVMIFSTMICHDIYCHDIYCHDSYCHDIYCPPSADLPLRP